MSVVVVVMGVMLVVVSMCMRMSMNMRVGMGVGVGMLVRVKMFVVVREIGGVVGMMVVVVVVRGQVTEIRAVGVMVVQVVGRWRAIFPALACAFAIREYTRSFGRPDTRNNCNNICCQNNKI